MMLGVVASLMIYSTAMHWKMQPRHSDKMWDSQVWRIVRRLQTSYYCLRVPRCGTRKARVTEDSSQLLTPQIENSIPNGQWSISIAQPVVDSRNSPTDLNDVISPRNMSKTPDLWLIRPLSMDVVSIPPEDILSQIGAAKPRLSALLFSDAVSASHRRLKPLADTFSTSAYSCLIYSIENNFAGLDYVQIGAVQKVLMQVPNMQSKLLKYLHTTPRVVAKALVENLIRAAIESFDASSVAEILRTGYVSANEIICIIDGHRYTAIERSAMLKSREVTQALLDAGADLNQTYGEDPYRHRVALECALQFKLWGRRHGKVTFDMHLVNTLLKSGTEFRANLFANAIRLAARDLVGLLLDKLSASEHQALFRKDELHPFKIPLVEVVTIFHENLAIRIVKQLIQACSQSGCGQCTKSQIVALEGSLAAAARRGFMGLVKFLLDYMYTTDLGLPLATAVRGRERAVVHLLLERGANVGCEVSRWEYEDYELDYAITPLSEAIRSGDDDLIQDFERRGALLQIHERCRFEAAMCAACEVGNSTYVQKLLQKVPEIDRDTLTTSLCEAILQDHVDIALMLDAACPIAFTEATLQGADTLRILLDAFRIQHPDGKKDFGASALKMAILMKDESILDLLLDAKFDVNALVLDSDPQITSEETNTLGKVITEYSGQRLDIVRKLILAGADPNGIVSATSYRVGGEVWPRRTALLQAIQTKSETLVALLISLGADVHRRATLGIRRTPLQYACEVGSIPIVDLLPAHGANVNEPRLVEGARQHYSSAQ